jgi:phosphohistidine phosphatase
MPDDARPLTEEGEKHLRQVARGLLRLEVEVDRILSSPLPRAWRTAEIVAEELECAGILERTDNLRPERNAASIREWLGSRGEERVMVVGHNPSLSDLISLLMTGQPGMHPIDLRKGGIAALSAGGSGGLMQLDWLARPRLFRRLDD